MRPLLNSLRLLSLACAGKGPIGGGHCRHPRYRPGLRGASALVNGTRHGYGKSTPKERQQKDVTILDIFNNAASAKAVMADWVDYMQLAKVDGRWLIVNVLWERKPGKAD